MCHNIYAINTHKRLMSPFFTKREKSYNKRILPRPSGNSQKTTLQVLNISFIIHPQFSSEIIIGSNTAAPIMGALQTICELDNNN